MNGRILLLGVVTGAHGVRGEVKIKTFTAAAEGIASYGPLTDESGARSFAVLSARAIKNGLVVARLSGVGTRDDAERLAGVKLHAPRSALPPPDEDEFYVADLIGLEAKSDLGRALGRVVAVYNFGAGDLLEIREGAGAALLLPFTMSATPIVDIPSGVVIVAEAALKTIGGEAEEAGEAEPTDGPEPQLDAMRQEDA